MAAGTGTPEALTKAEIDRRAAELLDRSRRALEPAAGARAGRSRFGATAPVLDEPASAEELAAKAEAARRFLADGSRAKPDDAPGRADRNLDARDAGTPGRVSELPIGSQHLKPGGGPAA